MYHKAYRYMLQWLFANIYFFSLFLFVSILLWEKLIKE